MQRLHVYSILARAAIRKNLVYVWSHMANNIGSALFGFIYMALWRAAAHGQPVGSFAASELIHYVAISQLVLWISTFLPRDLGVSNHVRSGQIALEFVRPIAYMPRILASGAGEVAYNILFRCVPLAMVFTVLGDVPWALLAHPVRLLGFLVALIACGLMGLFFQYLIGITSFWTIETRWIRRLYMGLAMFCGGQLIPIQLMPQSLHDLMTWLPFQTMVSFPVSVWLGKATLAMWLSAALWLVLLWSFASMLTKVASRRLVVQGG